MNENRLPDYLEHIQQAAIDARSFVDGLAKEVHIPVENEHLFRFKMNADSGLRVHRFRTPQCTYSDVR